MGHSSRHCCFLCTGHRSASKSLLPGDPAGRWRPGELRSHNSNLRDYNGFRAETEGMNWERAKEYAKFHNSVVREPLQLHPNKDLPYLHYLMIDSLHTIKLGRVSQKNCDSQFFCDTLLSL